MSPLAQALYDYALDLEEASEGTGVTYLEALRDKCLALVGDGAVTTPTSGTVNGQTFSEAVSVPADKMLAEVGIALRYVKDVRAPTNWTPAAFREIPL
jgi:hypothetical protein